MTTVSGQFSETGTPSGRIFVRAGDSYTLALTFSAGATVLLESIEGTVTRTLLATYTETTDLTVENDTGRDLILRLRCPELDEGETVDYEMANYVVPTNSAVTGNQTVAGTQAVTGAATFSSTVKVSGVTASNVTKILLDASGNALLARCATANIPTGAGYAKGCILIATDGTDHTNTLFANIGNATTANFNAVTIASD